MAFKGLAEFLGQLAERGELVRVAAEVDADLEIAEITRRVAECGGPALVFERVRGQSLPVVTNLLGTVDRACLSLDLESPDQIAERIAAVALEHSATSWLDRLKPGTGESGTEKLRPRVVKTGLCQQVVHLGRDVNLASFPLVRCWPGETGPSLLGGLLLSESHASIERSVTPVTLVKLDENRLAVIDERAPRFARHWESYVLAGQQMPVAVMLGADPALTIAAHLELPADVGVTHVVGLLRARPLEMVKCRTNSLEVPAEAELVVEGYLDPQAEQPVLQASSTGSSYRPATGHPVIHVTAVTHRTRAVVPAMIAGGRDSELATLAKARERMLLPTLQRIVPDLVDICLPNWGGSQAFTFVSLRKRFAHQARQVAAALWGTGMLPGTKFLVLVDAQQSVQDHAGVLAAVGENVTPERDLFTLDTGADPGDFAGSLFSLTRRVAIDATRKLPEERSGRSSPPLAASEETLRQVTARWGEYSIPLLGRPGGITGL